jgi:hypothetical protein
MDDHKNDRKKTPVLFEPGELEKTRGHLGNIDLDEAKRMSKLLGGKVGIEKAIPVDSEKIRAVAANYRASKATHNTIKKHSSNFRTNNVIQKSKQSLATKKTSFTTTGTLAKKTKRYHLPKWDSKNRKKLNKLMSSNEYRIQQMPNIFGRIFRFTANSNDKIMPNYVTITLKNDLSHIDKFIQAITHIIAVSSPIIKGRIAEEKTWQDKALHFITTWKLRDTKLEYLNIRKNANNIDLSRMVIFTRSLYKAIIKLFFIGENNMTKLIKDIYSEIAIHTPEKKEALLGYAKIAAAEWLYIYGQVAKGMYPLLMRMSSNEYLPFPEYFSAKISDILDFLELTKYDLILPIKDETIQKEKQAVKEKQEHEQEAKKEAAEKKTLEIVNKSILALEKLFPEAGWTNLDAMPDMYPYFQPLYQFHDGVNLLPPSNPLQITLILLRILEDLFQSCRYINFTVQDDLDFVLEKDSLQDIFSTWSLYREAILGKQMIPELIELVDQLHSKSDFTSSVFGKRIISSWLWQEKFYFLPHLSFELIFMEKPNKDGAYVPLAPRVSYLRKTFSIMIQRADTASHEHENPYDAKINLGADNLWKKYEFEIPNVVSHRLDILLGGKKSAHHTNLNLLKYTLCVLNVLDWWINSEDSPAYKVPIKSIYRKDSEGRPVYSIPLMTNQNSLFIQHIKSALNQSSANQTK